jgi:hypothetical protein
MKNIVLIFFFIMSLNSFSQGKEFMNHITPTYPGCENNDDRSKCYIVGLGNLIVTELNRLKFSGIDKIQIELLIRTETNGKSTILKLKVDNQTIAKIAYSALEKMPLVKPVKSPNGRNETSSQGFFVTAIWNKKTNTYEVFYK